MSKKSFLKHSKIKKLSEWLKDKRTDVLGGKYCHLLLIEQLDKKNDVIGENVPIAFYLQPSISLPGIRQEHVVL